MRRDKIDVSLVFEDSKFWKYYRFNPCLSWFDTDKRSGLSQSKHLCFGMVVLIVIGWMRVDNHHPIDVVHVREHGNAHLVGHEQCQQTNCNKYVLGNSHFIRSKIQGAKLQKN